MAFKVFLGFLCVFILREIKCDAGKLGGFMGGAGMFQTLQLRFALIAAQREASIAASTANTTIQSNIATGQNTIDRELLASEAKVKAVAGAPQTCVDQHQAALALITTDDVNACDQAAELESLNNVVGSLGMLHIQISGSAFLCPPGSDPTCWQNVVDQTQQSIDAIKTAVDDGIIDAVDGSANCIDVATKNAHDGIVAADNDFDACVQVANA